MSAKMLGHLSHIAATSAGSPPLNPMPKRSPFFVSVGPRYMRGPVKLKRAAFVIGPVGGVCWISPAVCLVVSVRAAIGIYFLLYA